MIKLKEVAKTFDSIQALRGITLSVMKGVSLGLIGPNASGKTTTLNIIVGFIKPDYGEVRVRGLDPWLNFEEVHSFTGIMHENPIFPRRLKVKEFLEIVADLKGVSLNEYNDLIHMFSLSKYLEAKINSLSRGYLQRLNLVQALIGNPQLLILDEPTANLDPAARFKVLSILKKLKKRGVTIIVSSHLLGELETFCDEIALLNRGYLIEKGRLSEIAEEYGLSIVINVKVPRGVNANRLVQEILYLIKGFTYNENRNVIKLEVTIANKDKIMDWIRQNKLEILEIRSSSLHELYLRIVGEVHE